MSTLDRIDSHLVLVIDPPFVYCGWIFRTGGNHDLGLGTIWEYWTMTTWGTWDHEFSTQVVERAASRCHQCHKKGGQRVSSRSCGFAECVYPTNFQRCGSILEEWVVNKHDQCPIASTNHKYSSSWTVYSCELLEQWMTSFVCPEYLATLYYKKNSSLEKVQTAFFCIFFFKTLPLRDHCFFRKWWKASWEQLSRSCDVSFSRKKPKNPSQSSKTQLNSSLQYQIIFHYFGGGNPWIFVKVQKTVTQHQLQHPLPRSGIHNDPAHAAPIATAETRSGMEEGGANDGRTYTNWARIAAMRAMPDRTPMLWSWSVSFFFF